MRIVTERGYSILVLVDAGDVRRFALAGLGKTRVDANLVETCSTKDNRDDPGGHIACSRAYWPTRRPL